MRIKIFNKFKINIVYLALFIILGALAAGIYLTYSTKYKLNDQDANMKAAPSIDAVGEVKTADDIKKVIEKINNINLHEASSNDEYYFDSEIDRLN